MSSPFDDDFCEDCCDKETCPDYKKPAERLRNDFMVKVLRKLMKHNQKYYRGPIEIRRNPEKNALKAKGKPLTIRWEK